MSKKLNIFILALFLLSNIAESAWARAGGRSSFGGGRSSTSYGNQGSRGSRTYEPGGSGGRNYAPMQRSNTNNSQNANSQNSNSQNARQENNFNKQQQAPQGGSFFQRHPILTGLGAGLAGSWIGHMLFGNSAMGGYGAGGAGGSMMNFFMILILIAGGWMLFKFWRRRSANLGNGNNMNYGNSGDNISNAWQNNSAGNSASGNSAFSNSSSSNSNSSPWQNNSAPVVAAISLNQSDNQQFAQILTDIQNAWSNQDIEKLRRLTTPEMLKYFSDALSQNISQSVANKVEDVEVIAVNPAESWSEDDMEYATAILEWSAKDYMINLNADANDGDYVVEGDDKNLQITSEAWTFARYNGGKWILSAIAQIE